MKVTSIKTLDQQCHHDKHLKSSQSPYFLEKKNILVCLEDRASLWLNRKKNC